MFPRVKVMCAALVVAVMSMPMLPAAPVPASAADSALAVVPAQASIVVQIRGVDRVRDRVKAVVQAAAPDFAPIAVAGIDGMFGRMFEGRKMTGVVANGPVFVAFMEMPTQENVGNLPPIAVIVRVTKYTEFRDNFLKDDERKTVKVVSEGIEQCDIGGNESFLVDKRDYAVIAPTKQIAEAMAKGSPGLDGKLPKEMAAKILENDVSFYVNLTTVNQVYGDQIRQAREMTMALMDQAGLDKSQVEVAKKLYGGMFQVVLDGKSAVFALDFRPEGFALHLQAQVGAESETNQILRTQKPADLNSIGKLPAGQVTYTATDMGPEMTRMMAAMMKMSVSSEGDAGKLIDQAYTQLSAAKGRAVFASTDIPPAGVTYQEFGDPTQALSGTLALYKGLGNGAMAMGGAIKGQPEIKPDAESHRGIKFTSVQMKWDFDKMAEQIPGAGDGVKDAMKKMMGEGINMWVGIEGKRLITALGKDWNDAKRRMDAFLDSKKTVDQTPAYQLTRKQLPVQNSMMYLIDAGPITNVMADYMVAIFKAMPVGLPINLPDSVKPVPTETSYIGFSVTMQPEQGSVEMFLPVKAVEEMKKVIMQLFMGG